MQNYSLLIEYCKSAMKKAKSENNEVNKFADNMVDNVHNVENKSSRNRA